MTNIAKSFGSDNHSGIHPRILEAIAKANQGHVPAYGDDIYTSEARKIFSKIFGREVDTYFVFNGTGANVLSLLSGTRSYNSVVCVDTAHINVDECGAPEKHLGAKLLSVSNCNGKLTVEAAKSQLHGFGFCHHNQPKFLSITQSTEMGTVYSVEEIDALADLAHSYGMYLHLDGARIANAVASLGVSVAQMTKNVDVVSFGGTKNGMMLGEAVVVINEELKPEMEYKRKQLMQLCSKMRFVAAQYIEYFRDDLWLELAGHSNSMARVLAERLSSYFTLTQRVESNEVFVIMPQSVSDELIKRQLFYVWDEATGEVRFVCSFDTTLSDIDNFMQDVEDVLARQ